MIAIPPRPVALKIAGWLGRLAFRILGNYQRQTLANLTLAFGHEKKPAEIRAIGRDCFIYLAKNVVDIARFPRLSRADFDQLIVIENLAEFDAAFKHGKGLVALTGHIGNWELMGAWFSLRNYPITAIGRKLFDYRLTKMLTAARESKGIKNVDRNDAARAILKCLRKGEIVGILIDQNTNVDSVEVNFFGQPARTPIGLARLVQKTGAAVIPMAVYRLPDDRFRIIIDPPVYPLPGDENVDAVALTQRFNDAIEKLIRRDPAQWVWMHRRWRGL